MLFEEPVAKMVGDILTVEIAENFAATGKENSSLDRNGTFASEGTADSKVPWIIKSLLQRNNMSGSSDIAFTGKGSFENNKKLTATLAATVVDVLPNGNLLIGGEKWVSAGDNQSILRLTGVISKKDIKAGNVVSSLKMADARLELVGKGVVADANTLGWMQRLFLSVLSPY
jgi:flagellar L-ring protein precursor FlgH